MDELANLELSKLAEGINPPKGKPGRRFGSKNYGWHSHIARRMKEKGISWQDELIDAYMLYKKQLAAGGTPDPSLLYFWQEILPYISIKASEKMDMRERPAKRVGKRKISRAALDALAKAEGRKS